MGSVRRRKNKDYYAVIEGRLDKPTIFSSWYYSQTDFEYQTDLEFIRGDAHPRVTGCSNRHKGFLTIEEARKYMAKHGVAEYDEVIKDMSVDTTPKRMSMAYYAVAFGRDPGIYPEW